jgi:hypothetical protein
MRKIIYLLTFVLTFANISKIFSQEAELQLSLKDALLKATQNNRQISKAKAQGKAAKAEFRQTNSVFLPNLNLSHTAITTNDPLAAFGFKLKQEITAQADFNPVFAE